MLWATNAAIQSIGEDALISFDTVIARTNDNVTVVDDQILITEPGWYEIAVKGVFINLSSSNAIPAGVRLLSNEEEVPGSETIWNVPASGYIPAYVSMPVHVVPAADGTATLAWQMTNQANLRDVMLMVERKI